MSSEEIIAQCCVVGGGPAGMMLGFLLARAGVSVTVLEKHADFLRDFRGDTVHPATLELMYELGLLEEFLQLPHRRIDHLSARIGGQILRLVELGHLPTHCKYVALMPQWDLLNFLARQGQRYRTFDLRLCTEARGLIEQAGSVQGVRAKTAQGELSVRAKLVVACDGRHSTLRACSGLSVADYGVPMDVLWFRVRRHSGEDPDIFAYVDAGAMLVLLDRGDYWQCAYVIPKGGFESVRSQGIETLRRRVRALAPFLSDRIGELQTFDDVKLLSVTVNRLRQWWRPGLLCIGDAAHAMSPIGGVGINIAVQDAVAAANRLAVPLKADRLRNEDLRAVQRRRAMPAYLTQSVQRLMQSRLIGPALQASQTVHAPWPLKLLNALPPLRRLPARVLAMGFRPEHIQTADILASAPAVRD